MTRENNDLALLVIWLHSAASEAGQVEMVRKLIRSAFESAAELYGLPNDSEILVQPRRRRGLNRLERIPEIVSRFAAEWDEYDRDIPEAEAPANAKKPAKRRKKPKNPRKKDS